MRGTVRFGGYLYFKIRFVADCCTLEKIEKRCLFSSDNVFGLSEITLFVYAPSPNSTCEIILVCLLCIWVSGKTRYDLV